MAEWLGWVLILGVIVFHLFTARMTADREEEEEERAAKAKRGG